MNTQNVFAVEKKDKKRFKNKRGGTIQSYQRRGKMSWVSTEGGLTGEIEERLENLHEKRGELTGNELPHKRGGDVVLGNGEVKSGCPDGFAWGGGGPRILEGAPLWRFPCCEKGLEKGNRGARQATLGKPRASTAPRRDHLLVKKRWWVGE